ncbi:MAG: ATPase [Bacteroidales bacterium]|jgi:N-acetylglucosamine kinase-like BadF-type ATPase
MKLIADSGSTKTSWALLDKRNDVHHFSTRGHNPYYYSDQELREILQDELLPNLSEPTKITSIFFYGSGCSSKTNCNRVEESLQPLFIHAAIQVHHDLYGAALSLLHHESGIACILGTGSNSCQWDGHQITANVPSLGFMLADEGSGTTIGKNLLKGLLKGEADTEITRAFYNHYNLTFEKTLDLIYKQPEPNRFMASLTRFALKHIENPWCRKVVKQSLDDFVTLNVKQYKGHSYLPIAFTGSIAYHFKEVLREVCDEHGLTLGTILKDPIEGLVRYHQK